MIYSMSDLLQLVVAEGAADLHLRVGVPPVIRLHGVLHRVEGPPLKPEDTEELLRSITSEEAERILVSHLVSWRASASASSRKEATLERCCDRFQRSS